MKLFEIVDRLLRTPLGGPTAAGFHELFQGEQTVGR